MLKRSTSQSTSKYFLVKTLWQIYWVFRAYQTLSDPQKRAVYDSTGMSANEQQGADINFDGFTSFSQVFRSAFSREDSDATQNVKSYEEILEEYEKFFSLDQEV